MAIRKNIEALLELNNIGQESFARTIGVSQGAVSQWLNGRSGLTPKSIKAICKAYNLTPDDIVSDSHGLYAKVHSLSSDRAALPLQSYILPKGEKIQEKPNIMVGLPEHLAKLHPKAYFIEIKSDCMNKVYPEGCYILIDPEKQPGDGDIAVVSIDDSGYMTRRLKTGTNNMMLSPESTNPSHIDIFISNNDERTVKFAGSVVWFQAKEEL